MFGYGLTTSQRRAAGTGIYKTGNWLYPTTTTTTTTIIIIIIIMSSVLLHCDANVSPTAAQKVCHLLSINVTDFTRAILSPRIKVCILINT